MIDDVWHEVTRAMSEETMANFALSGHIVDDLLVWIFNYDPHFDGLTDNQKIAWIMRNVLEYGVPDDDEIKDTLAQFDNWVESVKEDYPQQYARENWGDRTPEDVAVAVARVCCFDWQIEFVNGLMGLIK